MTVQCETILGYILKELVTLTKHYGNRVAYYNNALPLEAQTSLTSSCTVSQKNIGITSSEN